MKKGIRVLTIIFIISNFFIVGERGVFVFNNEVFAAGNATILTTIRITVCGNNIKETNEQCDNTDLDGATCSSRGFTGGTLSCGVACDFNTSACTSDGGGGGGGGGGTSSGGGDNVAPVTTSAVFSGRAYPRSSVTLLKDAQIVATTIASTDANFQISISSLSGGNYIFSLYSEDKNGIRSSLLTFPVGVTSGATTNVSGIFISPTVAIDKSEVKRGDNVIIFGQSAPQSDILISVNSDEEFFQKTVSDKDGIYVYNFDTSVLDYGTHSTKSKASIANQLISSWSYLIGFTVGTKTVFAKLPTIAKLKGDLNNDGRVNLVDFSIVAYWYKRTLSTEFKPKEAEQLNNDGKVDLIDFSIMAYYWTG